MEWNVCWTWFDRSESTWNYCDVTWCRITVQSGWSDIRSDALSWCHHIMAHRFVTRRHEQHTHTHTHSHSTKSSNKFGYVNVYGSRMLTWLTFATDVSWVTTDDANFEYLRAFIAPYVVRWCTITYNHLTFEWNSVLYMNFNRDQITLLRFYSRHLLIAWNAPCTRPFSQKRRRRPFHVQYIHTHTQTQSFYHFISSVIILCISLSKRFLIGEYQRVFASGNETFVRAIASFHLNQMFIKQFGIVIPDTPPNFHAEWKLEGSVHTCNAMYSFVLLALRYIIPSFISNKVIRLQ